MTILYRSPVFQKHQTGRHPERVERLVALEEMLEKSGLGKKCTELNWKPVTEKELLALHAPKQVETIRQLASHGGGNADPDTIVCPDSFEVAMLASGACIDAVDQVLNGKSKNALALVRPPGHHANATTSMGFCLFNNVALAARHAIRKHQLNRVLILDWDVHHGNGTQDIFYEDDQTFFISIHRYGNGFYPGTGSEKETGSRKGLGFNLNIPISFGTTRDDYRKAWSNGLRKAEAFKPELVLISAGFDADRRDPIGSLGLDTEDFGFLADSVCEFAKSLSGGKVVACLEGGYHLEGLANGVEELLKTLIKHSA